MAESRLGGQTKDQEADAQALEAGTGVPEKSIDALARFGKNGVRKAKEWLELNLSRDQRIVRKASVGVSPIKGRSKKVYPP